MGVQQVQEAASYSKTMETNAKPAVSTTAGRTAQVRENITTSWTPETKNTADGSKPANVTMDAGTEAEEFVGVGNNSQIKKAVEEINKMVSNSEAIFGIHDGTNRVMIKIVDKDTKEVIKEYPPEKTLDMIEKVWEVAGLLVDEKL